MNKRIYSLFVFFFILILSACSGGGGGTGGNDQTKNYFNPNTAPDKILFDVTTSNIPLPNDAALDNGTIKFTTNTTPAIFLPVTKSYDNLSLAGLSPNTPIYIPLNTNNEIDVQSLYQNIFLVPVQINVVKSEAGINPIAGPENLNIEQEGNCIKIMPLIPLIPNAKYAVIIKMGVKFKDGSLLGRDASYELLFDTYSQIIKALNLNTKDILAMFTFTTANKTVKLMGFKMAEINLQAGNDVNLKDDNVLIYDNITEELETIIGAVNLFPVKKLADNITMCGLFPCNKTNFISYDITTLTKIPLPDALQVPIEIIPAIDNSTDKVVIFQHGLGGSKDNVYNSQFAFLTQKLIASGFNLVSMDLPYHGERVQYDNLTDFDCNGDGQVKSGECFLTANLVQDRVNIYQSVFDLSLLLKGLRTGAFDINGDGLKDNVTKVYFVGISMGAITGSIFVSLNLNNLEKIVLNVGGANFAAILDGTAIPDLNNALNNLGFIKNTPQYIGFLGLLDLILDPSDPMYYVNETLKDKVIIQNAYRDIIVPNTSNWVLAKKLGYLSPVYVNCEEDFNNNSPGWYMFGNPEWVTHAFLISYFKKDYPEEVQQFYDEDYIKKCQEIAQDQIFKFFVGGK